VTLVCLLAWLSYARRFELDKKGWGFQGKPVLIFAIEAKLHTLVERLIEKGAHAEGYTVIWPLFLA